METPHTMTIKTETPPILPFGRKSPGALVGGALLAVYTISVPQANNCGKRYNEIKYGQNFP